MQKSEPDGKTNLPALADLFHALRRGRHISAADGALYSHLCAHAEAYRTLLEELGFTLRRHPRDFFYLEDTANFTDIAARMALFFFILVEHLADRGLPVEDTLMSSAFAIADMPHLTGDRYRELMREAEITTPDQLNTIISTLDRYGFIRRLPDERFECLPPTYRFLDLCLQYASDEKTREKLTREPNLDGGMSHA